MPEDFFRTDVRVGEMQHLEFARQLYMFVYIMDISMYILM